MKSLVAPLPRRAWTCYVHCMSVVSISTSRERKVVDGVEAMVYLCERWCFQFGMHTWRGRGTLAGVGGRGSSIAVKVSTGLHVEESREGVVLEDSIDKHAKQLELGSEGLQSIHCNAKNPLVCPYLHPPASYLSPLERVHL